MIVIATHNGYKYLKNLLIDIKLFNVPNNKVCIVDNLSEDKLHINYLENLKKEGYNILFNPKSTFELGAYKYAVDNLEDDYWFFIQDSIRIKTDIFSEIIPKLTDFNAYTFLTFKSGLWDNQNDIMYLTLNYGTIKYSKGVFANCFFAKNSVIQKIKNQWILPKNKIESMGTERGLSVIFDKNNIELIGLDMYDPNKSGDPNAYPFFQKIYGGRNI